jgi:hypothetical protein
MSINTHNSLQDLYKYSPITPDSFTLKNKILFSERLVYFSLGMRPNPKSRMNGINTGHESLRIRIDISLVCGIENNVYLGCGFRGRDTVYSTCGCQYFRGIYCCSFQGNLKLEAVWSYEMLVITCLNTRYHNTTDHSDGQRFVS